jgi:hypothetical protein
MVYHMPLDPPGTVDLTSQTGMFAQTVRDFLAPRVVKEVGVVANAPPKKEGTWTFKPGQLEKKYVYVLLAKTPP